MRMEVRGAQAAADRGLRALAERRLRFALARFAPRIGCVVVRLTDVNGPRGGVDKRCRVRLRLAPRGELLIDQVDSDWRSAIERAARRAARGLPVLLGSSRQTGRRTEGVAMPGRWGSQASSK